MSRKLEESISISQLPRIKTRVVLERVTVSSSHNSPNMKQMLVDDNI